MCPFSTVRTKRNAANIDTLLHPGKTTEELRMMKIRNRIPRDLTAKTKHRRFSSMMRKPLTAVGLAIAFAFSGVVVGASSASAATVVGPTTTVTWMTFIPLTKIEAPPVGCDYGNGYQFGGDNHKTFDWKSSHYRT